MNVHEDAHCQQLLARLNDYIDGDLDSDLCRLLEAHLDSCSNCTIVLNTLEKTIELCKLEGEKTTLPDETRQRLMNQLFPNGQDQPTTQSDLKKVRKADNT